MAWNRFPMVTTFRWVWPQSVWDARSQRVLAGGVTPLGQTVLVEFDIAHETQRVTPLVAPPTIVDDHNNAALAVPLVASSPHAAQTLAGAALPAPCAWVFGHEGQGVAAALAVRCALELRIPQPGGEESLNVAAAAAVCLYESARRMPPKGAAAPARPASAVPSPPARRT